MEEPRIKVYGSANEVTISGNVAGLRWLAEQLDDLTSPELHNGYHMHLDPGVNLEDGTVSLILARDEEL
ncbi:Imm32 family immunity protein [Streptacidiphilus sp. PAMC 29251]